MENKTLKKIELLLKERNWTLYRLAKESDMPHSSLSNLFTRNTEPTLPTLRSICQGFGISLSEFFADESSAVITDFSREERSLIENYRMLRKTDRKILRAFLAGLLKTLPAEMN